MNSIWDAATRKSSLNNKKILQIMFHVNKLPGCALPETQNDSFSTLWAQLLLFIVLQYIPQHSR